MNNRSYSDIFFPSGDSRYSILRVLERDRERQRKRERERDLPLLNLLLIQILGLTFFHNGLHVIGKFKVFAVQETLWHNVNRDLSW